jgi:glucose/arabinose dehydrogenase
MKLLTFYLSCVFTIALFFPSCYKLRGHYGTRSFDKVNRPINNSDIILPGGYQAEPVTSGLNFPTSITFDENGNIYILEAGYCYGEIFTIPKLLKLENNGSTTEIAHGDKNGPWTSVDYHKGYFYVSEGGTMNGGRILKISPEGKITRLVENLPSFGDHHTNGVVVGPDGYIYFGQGTATNSGVVGNDNFGFGWLDRKRDFHDIPCEDVVLAGENYETENVLSPDREKIKTGAFVAYGTKTEKGQVIKGSVPCSGAVMRVPLEGGKVELVAWGFRNPYGLRFTKDGQLYVSDNGFDVRGSRKVYGTGDLFWKVENNKWYGWPDFSGGDSLADPDYKSRNINPKQVLLKRPGTPPEPVAVFGVHSSSNGFDFSTNPAFGFVGHAFVAQFGDMAPNVGSIYGPVGFKIVEVDTKTGIISDFAVNKGKLNGPASQNKNGGLERPVEAKFSRDGSALYIVDFGVLEMPEQGPAPKQNTGVIWKVTHNSYETKR